LDILHRENLDATLAEFGLENTFGQDERVALNQSWEKLLAWTESKVFKLVHLTVILTGPSVITMYLVK
jgi:hypothetical protein